MECILRELRNGDRGTDVRLVQEWLCLRGVWTAVDGVYGAATEHAVREFQAKNKLHSDGVAGRDTWAALSKPMADAISKIAPEGRCSREMMVAYARRHLKSRPREVGGQNRGPWVRLYMGGRQGDSYPWCAGFVSYVMKQAFDGRPALPAAFSCDEFASAGLKMRAFVPFPPPSKRAAILPGFIFLVRKSARDWTHAGIVTEVRGDSFSTIEGNTNDEGSREGFEVCARVRAFNPRRPVDFIRL